jgi:hypothetical protein
MKKIIKYVSFKSGIAVFLLLCLVLGVVLVVKYFWYSASDTLQPVLSSQLNNRQILPHELDGLILGINKIELLKKRSVKAFNDSLPGKEKIFFEKVTSSPFYSSIMYFFSERANDLEIIILLKNYDGSNHVKKNYHSFIKSVLKKWGDPSKIVIEQMSHRKLSSEVVTLIWIQNTVIITATYPSEIDLQQGKEFGFALRVLNSSTKLDSISRIVKNPKTISVGKAKEQIERIKQLSGIDELEI